MKILFLCLVGAGVCLLPWTTRPNANARAAVGNGGAAAVPTDITNARALQRAHVPPSCKPNSPIEIYVENLNGHDDEAFEHAGVVKLHIGARSAATEGSIKLGFTLSDGLELLEGSNPFEDTGEGADITLECNGAEHQFVRISAEGALTTGDAIAAVRIYGDPGVIRIVGAVADGNDQALPVEEW